MIERVSLDSLSQDYARATAWLETMGVGIAPTRLQRYSRALDEVQKAIRSGAPFSQPVRVYYSTLAEIAELCRIVEGCQRLPRTSQLETRLAQIRQGADSATDEVTPKGVRNSQPRDTGFELVTASLFAKGGLNTLLPDVGDVEFVAADKLIFAECKRIASIDRLEANIDKAFDQINVKRKATPDALGMVFVDVSPFFNENVSAWAVPDEATMHAGIETFLTRVRHAARRHYAPGSRGPHAVAVGIRLATMIVLENPDLVVHNHQWVLDTHPCSDRTHWPVVAEILNAINRAIPDESLSFQFA